MYLGLCCWASATHPAQIQSVPSQGWQPLCGNQESCLSIALGL